jgi:hypothetical protein
VINFLLDAPLRRNIETNCLGIAPIAISNVETIGKKANSDAVIHAVCHVPIL